MQRSLERQKLHNTAALFMSVLVTLWLREAVPANHLLDSVDLALSVLHRVSKLDSQSEMLL